MCKIPYKSESLHKKEIHFQIKKIFLDSSVLYYIPKIDSNVMYYKRIYFLRYVRYFRKCATEYVSTTTTFQIYLPGECLFIQRLKLFLRIAT